MSKFDFFATTARGLEEVLSKELIALGMEQVHASKGGVVFKGDMAQGYKACLWLRTANRILRPLSKFSCPNEQTLYEQVRSLRWETMLTPAMTLAVDANLRDSAMTHSRFAALKTKDAIVDTVREHFGQRPNVDTQSPDVRVNVHLANNQCTLSLDLSGRGMHRRGYRLDGGLAPLKETLAAGLVALSGWEEPCPFVDPMCGSGTLPIEAALIASNTAPGLLSMPFGFQKWLDFDAPVWQQLIDEAQESQKPRSSQTIFASDQNRGILNQARRNARSIRSGLTINWSCHNFFALEPPPGRGTLILNPPYGERLGDMRDLEIFYRQIGDRLKRTWSGWSAWILVGNLALAKQVGLKPSQRIVLFNGPIECRFLKFDLY